MYINVLINEGYLVLRSGNTYDFYETPHELKKKRIDGSSYGDLFDSQEELKNLYREQRSSFAELKPPQSDKEINNT